MWGKKLELEKGNKKIPVKDKLEILNVIPLMPLVGVDNRQPILHIHKKWFNVILQMKVLNNLQLVT